MAGVGCMSMSDRLLLDAMDTMLPLLLPWLLLLPLKRLPLVRFDFFRWAAPFSAEPNCDPAAHGKLSCGPAASAAPLDAAYRDSGR